MRGLDCRGRHRGGAPAGNFSEEETEEEEGKRMCARVRTKTHVLKSFPAPRKCCVWSQFLREVGGNVEMDGEFHLREGSDVSVQSRQHVAVSDR